MADPQPLSREDIHCGSGEPRLASQRLADALGPAAKYMRDLVEVYREDLSQLGWMPMSVARTQWLNKKQALYLCTKIGGQRVTEATLQVVDAFDAWRDLQSPPKGRD